MKGRRYTRDPKGAVYVLFNPETGHHKIGASASPSGRQSHVSGAQGVLCELVHEIPSNDIYRLEKHLHESFAAKRVKGEWFNLTAEDVASLKQRTDVFYTDPEVKARAEHRQANNRYVVLSTELWAELAALTEMCEPFEGRSVSWVCRHAVKEFLKAHGRKSE